jgi:hypothetical protein
MATARILGLVLSALMLAACSPAPEPDTAQIALTPPPEAAPSPPASTPPPAPEPAYGPAQNVATVIHLEGFGPARFGDDEESVRIAWGRPLAAQPKPEGSTCYFLFPDPPPPGAYGIVFMIEDGAFSRFDVNTPEFVAPGDLAVGMTADAVMAAFPGQIEERPHKYVPGERYLIYTPADGTDSRMVFEVDTAGLITQWRIGRLPQVEYVEGCN